MPTLYSALRTVIQNDEFVQAMYPLVDGFDSYRERLPRIDGACSRTLLTATLEFEVVAMRWAPGSRTAVHDHATSRCWVVMLDGVLDVENYDRLDDGAQPFARLRASDAAQLRRGAIDYRLGPREFHRVENNAVSTAYSLQLYAKPLKSFTAIADEATGRCEIVPAIHDAVLSPLLAKGCVGSVMRDEPIVREYIQPRSNVVERAFRQ